MLGVKTKFSAWKTLGILSGSLRRPSPWLIVLLLFFFLCVIELGPFRRKKKKKDSDDTETLKGLTDQHMDLLISEGSGGTDWLMRNSHVFKCD
jgi:hypothetical protein